MQTTTHAFIRHPMFFFAGVFLALIAWSSCRDARGEPDLDPAPYRAALRDYDARLDTLDHALDSLRFALRAATMGEPQGADDARRAFRRARLRFKRVEMLTEYYAPQLARDVNGPVLVRADEDDPETPLDPIGFQAVEDALFPTLDRARLARTMVLVTSLRGSVAALRRLSADSLAGAEFLFDAARQEIARVATLGVAGFDAPVSDDAIVESAAALEGVRDALAPWRALLADRDPALARALDARFDAAIADLRTHPDFDSFDRFGFIVRFVQPLAHEVADMQRALRIEPPARRRAWSTRAASIYDADAVDARFYAPDDAPRGAAIAALGAALFFNSRLSPSRTRSCASCHAPRRAFTDGRALPSLLETHPGAIVRNTPSLVGVATQPDLFADERAHFLEDQITDVLGSGSEMGGSLDQAASVLRADTAYRRWFAAAFADGEDAAVTPRRVRFAIASYLRGIPANHSRFDRAIAGDSGALSPAERQGFNLFMGRAGCGTCHFPPGFSGATPPTLVESEPEVLGVPVRWPARRLAVDPDPGRWGVRRTLTNRGAFKTPTLRNVAVTGPYMHNGAFRTIDEVIDFYDAGGGAGLGLSVPNQTLPADSLHLTRSEKRALIAFMRALTDSAYAPR